MTSQPRRAVKSQARALMRSEGIRYTEALRRTMRDTNAVPVWLGVGSRVVVLRPGVVWYADGGKRAVRRVAVEGLVHRVDRTTAWYTYPENGVDISSHVSCDDFEDLGRTLRLADDKTRTPVVVLPADCDEARDALVRYPQTRAGALPPAKTAGYRGSVTITESLCNDVARRMSVSSASWLGDPVSRLRQLAAVFAARSEPGRERAVLRETDVYQIASDVGCDGRISVSAEAIEASRAHSRRPNEQHRDKLWASVMALVVCGDSMLDAENGIPDWNRLYSRVDAVRIALNSGVRDPYELVALAQDGLSSYSTLDPIGDADTAVWRFGELYVEYRSLGHVTVRRILRDRMTGALCV